MKRREYGGGVFFGPTPHFIDYLIWLMGSSVTHAYAAGSWEIFKKDFVGECNVEDTVVALMRFKSGAVANVTASWKIRQELRQPMRIVGDAGALVQHKDSLSFIGNDGREEQCATESPPPRKITDLFVDWILYDTPFPAAGETAIDTARVLESAIHTIVLSDDN